MKTVREAMAALSWKPSVFGVLGSVAAQEPGARAWEAPALGVVVLDLRGSGRSSRCCSGGLSPADFLHLASPKLLDRAPGT